MLLFEIDDDVVQELNHDIPYSHCLCILALFLGAMYTLGNAVYILQLHQSAPALVADADGDVTCGLFQYALSLSFKFVPRRY